MQIIDFVYVTFIRMVSSIELIDKKKDFTHHL
jgi:hypothetical protein